MQLSPVRLAPFLLALEACGLGRMARPDAFGPGKPMAVVTITSPSRVVLSDEYSVSTPSGIRTYGNWKELANAAPMLPHTKAAVMRVLASSRRFRLLPESSVVASGLYASLRDGDRNRGFGLLHLLTPQGYKVLDGEQTRAVVRGVGARAGIMMHIDHKCSQEGANTVVGKVYVTIFAIDRSGQIVWKGWDSERADIPVQLWRTGVDLDALRQSLVQSAERTTRKILRGLDAQLMGR